VGSAETPVRIKLLDADAIPPGGRGFAQLFLRDALPLARGDRFVLRDAGRVLTLGGGVVLDPLPHRARRRDPGRITLLERLAGATPAEALVALVEAEGEVNERDALLRTGASGARGSVHELGGVLVSERRFRRLANDAAAALSAHHETHPLERGMVREALRAHLGVDPDSFDALLSRLPEIAEDGATVRLASHNVTMSAAQRRERDTLVRRLHDAGFTPPLTKR
jgi:selenocysteine-specific elongation factor